MANRIWSCVGILFLAIVLVIVIWTIANADTLLSDMTNWEEVVRLEGPNRTILILKNPIESDTAFAIVDVRSIYIAEYVLVGKGLRKFELKDFKTKTYEEVKLEFEEEQKIWSLLIKHAGIYSI